MRLVKTLLFVLIGLIALAIGAALLMPDTVRAERSVVIARKPSLVFEVLNGYRRFNDWSPWAPLDPHAVYTRSGPDSGVGATLAWKGNSAVGEGTQTIVVSEPGQRVQAELRFGPMAPATGTFSLLPEGERTKVTWTFESHLPIRLDAQLHWNLIGRLFGPWMVDSVGADFERGLASLKKLVEGMPDVDLAGLEIDIGPVDAHPMYFISTEATLDSAASTAAVMSAIGEISAFAVLNALVQAGPPRAVISGHDRERWQFDVAIPYDRNDAVPSGRIQAGTTHQGTVVLFKHLGSHDTLGDTHGKAHAWLAANGRKELGRRSEVYVSDPVNTPEAERLTILEVPVEP
jgi:effector-binding domain-containing protein